MWPFPSRKIAQARLSVASNHHTWRDSSPEKPCLLLPDYQVSYSRRPAVMTITATGASEPMLHPGSVASVSLSLVAIDGSRLIDPAH